MKWIRDSKNIEILYNMYKSHKLILRPFFQRNLVWSDSAKSSFIESILLGIPISEVYLSDGDFLNVIDGQQRLSTIFNFIDNGFKLKKLEKLEKLNNKSFLKLNKEYKKLLLEYIIYFVKVSGEKNDIIDMYSRINKYTVNLNKQELRKAIYGESEFLVLAEELSQIEFFIVGNFFTERKRQRMLDVEYISELLALLKEGIQDKKNTLEIFYDKYIILDNKKELEDSFIKIIEIINNIFKQEKKYFLDKRGKALFDDKKLGAKHLSKTRFKQQADFYSLFSVVKEYINYEFSTEELSKIVKLLILFDNLIEPESYVDIFSEYAIKCISQANTKNSKLFRKNILNSIFKSVTSNTLCSTLKKIKDEIKDEFEIDFDLLDFNLNETLHIIKEKIEEWND